MERPISITEQSIAPPNPDDRSARQNLDAALWVEEIYGEQLVNKIRIASALIFLVIGAAIRNEIESRSLAAIVVCSLISLAFAVALRPLLEADRHRGWYKYLASLVDIALLTAALGHFGEYRIFKSPAFLLYFLWITLAALRFNMPFTIYTGGLSVISYVWVSTLAVVGGDVRLGTMGAAYVGPEVSLGDTGLKVLFLAAFTGVAAQITRVCERLILSVASHATEAEHQRNDTQRMRQTFSQHVAPQVADHILSGRGSTAGERREVTVLFCDIRGFTKLADSLDPEEVVTLLNGYFERMIGAIHRYGGTVDKLVGDGIMAVWGAPQRTPRDAEMAIRAALWMRLELDQINAEREKSGLEPLRFGVGIHSGEAIAGNIGSAQRLNYTVVGSAVNIASRVESLTKEFGVDILLTEVIYAKVSHLIDADPQRSTRIRGISEPVVTYHLKGLRRAHGQDEPESRLGRLLGIFRRRAAVASPRNAA